MNSTEERLSALVRHSGLIELEKRWEVSITLDIKTLKRESGIDLSDPQSCLTARTDCLPLETQNGIQATELIKQA